MSRWTVLGLVLGAVGCAAETPSTYWVDPGCPTAVEAAVEAAVADYCEQAGSCLEPAPQVLAHWSIVCPDAYSEDRPEGSAGNTSWDLLNPQSTTELNMGHYLWDHDDADAMAYRLVAHELGHAHKLEHVSEPGWLMSERAYPGQPAALDGTVLCPLAGVECEVPFGVLEHDDHAMRRVSYTIEPRTRLDVAD